MHHLSWFPHGSWPSLPHSTRLFVLLCCLRALSSQPRSHRVLSNLNLVFSKCHLSHVQCPFLIILMLTSSPFSEGPEIIFLFYRQYVYLCICLIFQFYIARVLTYVHDYSSNEFPRLCLIFWYGRLIPFFSFISFIFSSL